MGIAFKDGKVKLFEQFFNSDIIVASPLGLRTLTGQEGENEVRRNYDFLSSIDILIMDQAEAFIYQNLDHLEEVLKTLNAMPKKLDGLNEITRIKDVYSDGVASKLR